MVLLKYDKKQTKKNADKELRLYRQRARLADEEFVPNVTATYSFELKSFTGRRPEPIENFVTDTSDAEQYLVDVAHAFNKMNAYRRQLLWYRYCDKREFNDIQIYMSMGGCNERQFYRILDQALQEFAESYCGGRLIAK